MSELVSAMSGTAQKTIYIKGNISVSGIQSVKDAQNKTIYGLPGSALVNSKHSSKVAESGILMLKNCKNIIIRNVTFKGAGAYDIDGNDNLTLQGCNYIWVDHCDFQDGVDGNLDANNGSDHIAITWCRFRYLISPWKGGSGGSDDHRNTCLWGGSDSKTSDKGKLRTTFANCWFDTGCHERNPRVRYGQVHIVNCYFSYTGANYCIGAGYASNIYAEKNVFASGVKNPWKCYATKSGYTDYNITMKGNSGASDEQKKSGSNGYFNPYSVYSYSAMDVGKVKSALTASNGAGATLNVVAGSGVKKAPSVLVRPDAETTAIRTVDSNISEPVETSYYSVNGSQQPRLQKGINIVKTRYSDGKVETKKIFVR